MSQNGRRFTSLGVTAVVATFAAACSVAAGERAMALLRGVEEARRTITAGRAALTVQVESRFTANQPPKHETKDLIILFDGEKRTSFQTSDILVVSPENANNYGAIASMPADEAVTSGAAAKRNQQIGNAWDGQSFANFWRGSGRATIRPAAKGTSELAFDPRTLGLSSDLDASGTITSYLGYDRCKEAEVVGREAVNGIDTWHVRVVTAVDAELQFWIEDAPGFRVHRQAWTLLKVPVSAVTESRFDAALPGALLPKKVTIKRMSGKQRGEQLVTITLNEFTTGKQSPAPGTLASLQLPVGTEVVDDRKDGPSMYWDGKSLAKSLSQPVPAPSEDKGDAQEPVDAATSGWVWAAGSVAVAAGIIAFVVRARGRRSPP